VLCTLCFINNQPINNDQTKTSVEITANIVTSYQQLTAVANGVVNSNLIKRVCFVCCYDNTGIGFVCCYHNTGIVFVCYYHNTGIVFVCCYHNSRVVFSMCQMSFLARTVLTRGFCVKSLSLCIKYHSADHLALPLSVFVHLSLSVCF